MENRGKWKRTAKHRAVTASIMLGSKRGSYKTRVDKGKSRKPLSVEHRAALSAAKIGKPGPWAGIKRGPQSLEWRANIGKGNKGKPTYYPKQRFHYKGVPFRSSWEMFVAQAFDAKGIKWQYEPTYFDLGKRGYRPDFYLPEQDVYWEVKGYFGPRSKETISQFREKFPEISLIVADKAVINLLDPELRLR